MGACNRRAKKTGWVLTQASHLYVYVNHRIIKKGGVGAYTEMGTYSREYGTCNIVGYLVVIEM